MIVTSKRYYITQAEENNNYYVWEVDKQLGVVYFYTVLGGPFETLDQAKDWLDRLFPYNNNTDTIAAITPRKML